MLKNAWPSDFKKTIINEKHYLLNSLFLTMYIV